MGADADRVSQGTPNPDGLIHRRRFGWLCLGYGMVMLYGSTIIGPAGINFVFHDPAAMFHQFLGTRFVAHGSDQRADWIGNLLMLVPFGFLVAGALSQQRPALRRSGIIGALLVCLLTILAIKYLQLFFPPRTVTLNYITAQAAGATIGCIGFACWRRRGTGAARLDPVAPLVLALRVYSGALLIFLLMPLDFALSADDLRAQLWRLPDTWAALPGEGGSPLVRVILISASAAAFVPVGMLLALAGTGPGESRRGLAKVTAMGLAVTAAIFAASTLVMGATPKVASIPYRTAGILAGAAILHWLVGQDIARFRQRLSRVVPWLLPLYLMTVLLVNRVLSVHWLTPTQAVEQFYPLGVLPLFDYYIVSKASAAKNIVGHVLLYMPIGAALWLRDERQRTGLAFSLAGLLSLAVEAARYFRPGLEGDINAVAIAGLSSVLTMRLMPRAWCLLGALAGRPDLAGGQAWTGGGPGDALAGSAGGEIEEY